MKKLFQPSYDLNLVNLTYGVESDDVEFNMTINQKGLLSMNTFLHKQSRDYFMQIVIAFDEGNGKFDHIYLNKTVDMCKFLSTPSYETLIQIYYKKMLKYENNFPTECPIGGGVSIFLFLQYSLYLLNFWLFYQNYYYLRNLEINSLSLPPNVPGSNAYIYLYFLLKEDTDKFKYLSGGKTFINLTKM